MNGKWLSVRDIDVVGKNVIVRADLEWPAEGCPRQKATEKIVEFLKVRGVEKIKVIGHKGHWSTGAIEIINDIRKDPREETDDMNFASELANGFDVYINEAFATSHRKHTSIDALPRLMVSQGKQVGIGLRFEKEIEILNKVFSTPHQLPPSLGGRVEGGIKRVLVIGGAKAGDKEKYAEVLKGKFDDVLKGGLLTGVDLRPDGLDISEEVITHYKEVINQAEMIVVAGPLGKYEDPSAGSGQADKGTREVFAAVANSKAYKIAGGGDTEAALAKFGLTDKFDWISVGGGAMLEYLAKGTLPGLEALLV